MRSDSASTAVPGSTAGAADSPRATGLARELGLLGLAATGICSMMGAAINVIPVMIHRNVPGIGPHVLAAYLLATVPAVLAALAYAILASAMPRAGGSYVYASRGLHPYLGFVASFSQWFGLSIAIGVVSYVLIPFLRDIAQTIGLDGIAAGLEIGAVRVALALAFLWTFVAVNVRGLQLYERTLVPLMVLMFVLGGIVIVAGFTFDHADFTRAVLERDGAVIAPAAPAPFRPGAFLAASAILFSSFIGFDSIAQAGGEAKNPGRNLPLAIGIAVATVGTFYLLFTAALYHAVPWQWVSEQAQLRDLTAPGILGYLLSPRWTVLIIAGAAIALINDLPAMLLAVSRLMFAWAEDGIFPRSVARVHAVRRTPHIAIVLSGAMASVGILGSHLAGDFFLGVDILVTSMLVNYLLMCVTVLVLPRHNARIARDIAVIRSHGLQRALAGAGALLLTAFLIVHLHKDMTANVDAWYFRSTWLWLAIMTGATLIYGREVRALRRRGVDMDGLFGELPPE